MKDFKQLMTRFAQEEEGAQVVEYALIIAVVSIGLVIALGGSGNTIASKFSAFADRVGICLSGTCK
jgi:pilus assembly protein Flp/PilA